TFLYSEFDRVLLAKAQTLSALCEQNHGQVKVEFDPTQMPEYALGKRPDYFEIFQSTDGSSRAKSPSLASATLGTADFAAERLRHLDLTLADGHAGRALAYRFQPRPEDEDAKSSKDERAALAVVFVARPIKELHDNLSLLRNLLVGLCTAAILSAA